MRRRTQLTQMFDERHRAARRGGVPRRSAKRQPCSGFLSASAASRASRLGDSAFVVVAQVLDLGLEDAERTA